MVGRSTAAAKIAKRDAADRIAAGNRDTRGPCSRANSGTPRRGHKIVIRMSPLGDVNAILIDERGGEAAGVLVLG